MHAPSLHKWHLFDPSITFVKHHQKLSEALLILIFLGLVAGVTAHRESLYVDDSVLEAEILTLATGNMEPLTRLTDPTYAHEQTLRKTAISTSLERLLETSQVERAYAVIYEYSDPTPTRALKSQLSEIFEVSQAHIVPRFRHFQGMSRGLWLQVQQNIKSLSMRSHGILQSYGFELQNERGVAIGYIGFERKKGDVPFQDWEITQLRKTAGELEQQLL